SDHIDIVKYLLDQESTNFSLKDINGYTAFDYAVKNKNIKIIKVFFQSGFNCGIKKNDFIKLLQNDCSDNCGIKKNDLIKLLQNDCSDINLDLLLLKAVEMNIPLSLIELMIENGANVD